MKELDYTALKTVQFVAAFKIHRSEKHTDSALTIEDLVAECENFTALKMDNTDMEGSHEIHAVQKKKVKCFNCEGPHYRSTCPLLSSNTGQKMRQKPRRRSYRRKRSQCKNCYRRTPCASTPGHLSPAEIFLGRQMRTPLTLLKETAKEEGTHNVRMEEQFNRHHGAQERSYHREDRVYVRDYRPGREKWIPARVKQRYGRAVSDMLTEGGDLWRRHANQMRGEEQHWVSCENTDAFDLPFHQENRRYKDMGETITDVEDNAEDRGTANVPLPTTTQPARRRRPPSRLQVDPKMKKYATRSSQEGGVGAVEINTDLTCYTS
ncbi:hypothetical protein ANCCAN_07694 [Ancylostoma caninum]|uniref:Uncharacterized protein n=1 Tax=Ancylostoma caninum TaxID=29170 RepID=A0A368GPQ5_ANCCA|nr:hypothetical protein ANCCAN_07694 [Ancylostoma caninum]